MEKRTGYKRLGAWIPLWAWLFFAVALICAACHLAFRCNAAFAETFNNTVGRAVRFCTAHLTAWLPVSLAEFVILSLPVTIPCLCVFCIRRAGRSRRAAVRTIAGLLAVLSLFYSMFVLSFAAGYSTPSLAEKLGIVRADVSAEELYETSLLVRDRLNELADSILFVTESGSRCPHSHKQTVQYCQAGYDKLAAEYAFLPVLHVPVKQIALSPLMTYTHISGMYTYYTGEANLNYHYPDFVNVYTTAHEMAHQRGISRENEANFLAYLVCIQSEDAFLRYGGYLNMLEYLASPLYSASPEKYREVFRGLDSRVRYDLDCYSRFFEKYRNSTASKVSDTVNDTYLKLQGTAEGSRSYGMVVDLAVAYHLHTEKREGAA